MSKFEAILKKIEEQTGTTAATPPAQQNTTGATQPNNQQQTPQPQAIQQAAKILGMDPKALEQIVLAANQNSQKPPYNSTANLAHTKNLPPVV